MRDVNEIFIFCSSAFLLADIISQVIRHEQAEMPVGFDVRSTELWRAEIQQTEFRRRKHCIVRRIAEVRHIAEQQARLSRKSARPVMRAATVNNGTLIIPSSVTRASGTSLSGANKKPFPSAHSSRSLRVSPFQHRSFTFGANQPIRNPHHEIRHALIPGFAPIFNRTELRVPLHING